jgi:prepilin-type processing-associated H-X9-DG protein
MLPPEQEAAAVAFAKKRHRARSNIVFCDGHVEEIKFTKLYSNKDESLQLWNNDNKPHRNIVPSTDVKP